MPDPDYHVGLNAGGVVFLNTASGGGNGWLLGTPLNLAPVYPPGVDAEICSINTGAVVAGVTTSSGGAPMFFYGGGAGFTQFAPPAMAATSGCAFINDAGRIAGSYLDSAGAPQGFVYAGGALVYFGMPGQVESLAVDAYSNKGRAVGSYFDPINQLWHLFWYNGSGVSVFGSFVPQTNLRLALNDNGILMLAVRHSNGGPTASYRILCAGDAC